MINNRQDSVIVKVNYSQNKEILIGGNSFISANQYGDSWRHKNPSLAEVVQGNNDIKKGMILMCHYNLFEIGSQLLIEETPNYGIYSVPLNDGESVIGLIDANGDYIPTNGNIVAERIVENGLLQKTSEFENPHFDRVVVSKNGRGYKKGQIIFTLKYANYEVFYNFNGGNKSVIKVNIEDIVGLVK